MVRPLRRGAAFVVRDRTGAVLLLKRPDKGLLASMLEPPLGPWSEKLSRPQDRAVTGAVPGGLEETRRHGAPWFHPFRTGNGSLCATVANGRKQRANGSPGKNWARWRCRPSCARSWNMELMTADRFSPLRPVRRANADAAHRSAPARRSIRIARRSSHCRRPGPAPGRQPGEIEPLLSAETSVPSARTFGFLVGARAPCSTVPGGNSPRSTTQPKGMRGSARLERVFRCCPGWREPLRQCGRAPHRHRFFPFDADEMPPQSFGHRPGCAGPKKGSEDHVARPGAGHDHPVQQGFRFSGWNGPSGRPRSFRRSAPAQIGSVQSERICSSSFSAFIAS